MMTVKKLLEKLKYLTEDEITNFEINGWINNLRGNKKIIFIDLNDGSTISNLQIILKAENFDLEKIDKWTQGSALNVSGKLVLTNKTDQPVELQANKIKLLSLADHDYPIQKQEFLLETMREIPHVRHRTKIIKSIMLIRSTLSQEIHNFFLEHEFLNFHSPIITSNDGEGAGETFKIKSDSKSPLFSNEANLSVTGQLHAEAYALGFNKVYTFGPTFRAENSNTSRHAVEFWMIEPEVAFFNLEQIINLADDLLKTVIQKTINKNLNEFKFLNEKSDNKLLDNLNKFLQNPVKIVEYKEAIKILEKSRHIFENQDIFFGLDLNTEHEKYLTDIHFKSPVAIINYPKTFKAFYMYLNDDKKTVAAFDLLVPGIGELIGGSQREIRIPVLQERIKEMKVNESDLKWYIDLRKFGNAGSSGFGLGFERLVMYVTGIENIRESIPFPRTPGMIKM